MTRRDKFLNWLRTSGICFIGIIIGWLTFHFATDFRFLPLASNPMPQIVLNGLVLVVASLGLGTVVTWIRRKEG